MKPRETAFTARPRKKYRAAVALSEMYRPGSQFKVLIKYARNLYDTEAVGTMDPYVKVVLGSREARTREKTDAGVNPVFEQELVLDFQNEAEVDFRVFDGETLGSDKFVGEARISVQAVVNNGGSWAGDLQLYRGGKKPAGLLNVQIMLVSADPAGSAFHAGAVQDAGAGAMYPDMPSMNPNYQALGPASQPQVVTGMNPNYQAPYPGAGAPPSQPQVVAGMVQGYPQPVYGQPVMAQAVLAQPTMYGQPGVVYGQPQVLYGQPQVVYRPPAPTYIYRPY